MVDLTPLDHETYVRRALNLAEKAARRGDEPYGSVLVHDDEIVMEASNRIHTEGDIALHPELTLARRAAREFDPETRAETVMYTSTEPCPMCSGGVSIAGLGAVVYSVSGATAAEIWESTPPIPCEEVCERWGRTVDVHGPVLGERGRQIHHDYLDGAYE